MTLTRSILLYDSGYGDNNRMIVFPPQNLFQYFNNPKHGTPTGHLKLFLNTFSNYTRYMVRRMVLFPPVCMPSCQIKVIVLIIYILLRKLFEIQPDLNPTNIMVDFEKEAINLFEEIFLP